MRLKRLNKRVMYLEQTKRASRENQIMMNQCGKKRQQKLANSQTF